MARVYVTCRHCRKDGVITADNVTLVLVAGQYVYTFNCPPGGCGRFNCKDATDETVGMLRAVGVTDNGPTNTDVTVTRFRNELADDIVSCFRNELADDDRVAAELEQLGRQ